ncbi:MAG: phytanoyl-CoA dioxygenase family protein [Thermomicrobiales bacterium]|nr:phytanoyl-CoA dioxygenase family protein [Thermomicrobiales bacterium]
MAHLSTQQIEQFRNDGYLVVDGLLDPERDLDPVIAEYEGVLDRLAAELFASGAISSTYSDLPFSERLVRIYAESGKVHAQYFDFSLPQAGITEQTPFWTGPAVFNTLRAPAILDAIESLIGPEIYSNPTQHVRLKPPEHLTPVDPTTGQVQLGATPWHQDNGVLLEDADESDIITVWFPLTDATIENGCLAVVPLSHESGLLPHCPATAENRSGFGVHIKERHFAAEAAVPLPMKRGSALFLTKRTVHCSLANHSDHVRFSFDLRYNPIGQSTGRSMFPGFVARSHSNPASELHDPAIWTELWREARRAIAAGEPPQFNRWDPFSPACA